MQALKKNPDFLFSSNKTSKITNSQDLRKPKTFPVSMLNIFCSNIHLSGCTASFNILLFFFKAKDEEFHFDTFRWLRIYDFISSIPLECLLSFRFVQWMFFVFNEKFHRAFFSGQPENACLPGSAIPYMKLRSQHNGKT